MQKIRNFLPGSNLSKLKLIIPKLLKLTDEIVVEGINSESNNLKVIPEMKYRYSSITELMDKLKSSRLIVTHDLSISLHQRTIPIKWCQEPSKVSFILTRDKFHYLPTNLTTRISKEHAKITGFVRNGLTIFEITSLSKNRIYYLGNKLKHPDGEELRTKIEKNIPYQFYNGDEFGLLTEKKNKTNKEKMLISFLLIIF